MTQSRHKTYLQIIKRTIVEFVEEGAFFHGAALSYYTLFALIPMLYLSIISFGNLIGQEKWIEIITSLFQNNIGIEDISFFTSYLVTLQNANHSWVLDFVVILVLLYSCSAFMVSLKYSMNEFYNVKKQKREKINILLDLIGFRFISVLLLAVFAFIIISMYFLQIFAFSLLENWISDFGGILKATASGLHHVFSIVSNLLIFLGIFKYVHDGKISWKLAFHGAILTAVLLYLSQIIIKYYLQNYFFLGKGNAIGSLFILLAWVYYTSQVIFFGAKFTYVLGKHREELM